MPQNPNENQDQQTSATNLEKKTWSAPEGTGAQSFVRIDNDDLHPERIERLGEYLSDTTRGDMSNPDVRGGQGNTYPVSPPGEVTPAQFKRQLDSTLSDATDYFEELSQNSAFEAGIATERDGTYGSGHTLLGSRKARSVVSEHIASKGIDPTSRWFGIGKERFKPGNDSKYQVQRSGTNLDQNLDPGAPAPSEPTAGTNYKNYRHKTGQTNRESMSQPDFWDAYFERLSYVGDKITLGAQGFKTPADAVERGKVTGLANLTGNPSLGDLSGNYAKVSLENTEAGNAFLDKEELPNGFQDVKSDFKKKRSPKYTTNSYGQMHSWNDPFESTGFPLIENRGITVAAQLLEIWAMSVLKTFTTTALLQIGSYLTSVILQNVQFDGEKGLVGMTGVNWNTNYYPDDPLVQPGTNFFKGYSGFNHPATNLGARMADGLNRGTASISNDVGGFFATIIAQQVGPPINSGLRSLDDLLNFTTHILRDLNIYMPRHIISQMAQEISYHDDKSNIKKILKNTTKLVDIATAYTRAMTIGMSTMAVHIIGDDYGKSLGFYRTLFREVVRSKAVWSEQRNPLNKWDSLLSYFGKDDKIMRFVNYLAQIGDMSIGAGEAGNIAFPENKVPLNQIGNHPSLRTIGGRVRGDSYQEFKSRLSMTETPSLFLLPKTVNNTRANLLKLGLENPSSVFDFADLNGANESYMNVGGEEATEGIKKRYQRKEGGRFDPIQVQRIEDQLEAEHLPFYIQDLRTNEIISFHAFLTSLSDSYSAEWSAQKGFGRMEAAQIYGGGSRAISVNFLVVPMNAADFDEMYYKINKLTTLVYPQWSQGTMMQNGDSTYVQPFSQVPTASPLCRIRVGDLFTSNYSDVAMARMMGVNSPKFNYVEPSSTSADATSAESETEETLEEQLAGPRHATRRMIDKMLHELATSQAEGAAIMKDWRTNRVGYGASYDPSTTDFYVTPPGDAPFAIGGDPIRIDRGAKRYLSYTTATPQPPAVPPSLQELAASADGAAQGISSLFDRTKNPIMKSFNSTMGRGIAVAITGIGLDWKLNSAPWNMEPGHKAPRMCEISLSLVPIHDITPGLDHEGVNRAPIYKVGKSSKSLTGDVWHKRSDYDQILDNITEGREAYLRAEERGFNKDE